MRTEITVAAGRTTTFSRAISIAATTGVGETIVTYLKERLDDAIATHSVALAGCVAAIAFVGGIAIVTSFDALGDVVAADII